MARVYNLLYYFAQKSVNVHDKRVSQTSESATFFPYITLKITNANSLKVTYITLKIQI